MNSIARTTQSHKSYRAHVPHRLSSVGKGSSVQQRDSVTLSSAASSEKRDVGKMTLFGSIGLALGVAASALLCPAAGLGALVLSGFVGGVTGAAIADGALETAGTKPAKPFDPYNVSDLLDPDNMYHPQNPNNPFFWSK